MKLKEALPLARKADKATTSRSVLVVSSLETYYFETFLKAYSAQTGAPVRTTSTEYGNLSLSLMMLQEELPSDQAIVLFEWEDFFPGASFRSDAPLSACHEQVEEKHPVLALLGSLADRQKGARIYVVPPVMAVAPMMGSTQFTLGAFDDSMTSVLHQFNRLHTFHSNIVTIDAAAGLRQLDADSWTDAGLWFKMGWPYSIEATSYLAEATCKAMGGSGSPKKLLITDLDDTIWQGVIGDQGKDGISWDHSESGYKHRIYQRYLQRLADEGVLVAVCSKNEESLAREGIGRPDLILNRESVVAFEIGWGPKSESIGRILSSLNLHASDAVFVDDSAFEINEVKANVAGINVCPFPKENRDILVFFEQLNSWFENQNLTEDDRNRIELYRARERVTQEMSMAVDTNKFLEGLKMELLIERVSSPSMKRPLQLLNKTNQFNINGIREDSASWGALFQDDHEIYQIRLSDSIADHGVIAVVVFRMEGLELKVYHFVLSCRVFSRRVEHSIVDWLRQLSLLSNCRLYFRFRKTEKNKPVLRFFNALDSQIEDSLSLQDIQWIDLGGTETLKSFAEVIAPTRNGN